MIKPFDATAVYESRRGGNMNNKQNMEDILGKSPLKENPFGVPKGYFGTMQREVMEKISSVPVAPVYNEEEAAPATLFTYLKPAIGLAAVFAIVFGMGYGVMSLTGVSKDDVPAPTLQADSYAAETVAVNSGTELTEEEVISIIGDSIEELFAQDNSTDSIVEIMQSEINEEEIEQYLIDSRVTTTALALLE